MDEHAVVIAGGGPTGLMLAGELALAGVDVLIVERRRTQALQGARAGGLHARTIEVLEQRGIADRFLAAGQVGSTFGFAHIPLDLNVLPTRHPYVLALWQTDTERLLAGWVEELGVPILRGQEVVGLAQDDDGVEVQLSSGTVVRSRYLVGCDGGRSVVRKSAGIDFPGSDPSASWMIAIAETDTPPQLGVRPEGGGIGPVDRARGGGPYGIVLKDPELSDAEKPTLSDLRSALIASYGTDFGVQDPSWISRFTDATRQAASYRQGRVLLAGDAAHVHPPQGGQGLNTGVQDAVNLGWKLAQVANGTSPESLLDTYHAERHAVGARVLRGTMATVAVSTQDAQHAALRDLLSEVLGLDEPRRRLAAMVSGLDIHYDLGEGHPLVGWRMPDLDLQTTGGPSRVSRLLHPARPVLLHLGGPDGLDFAAWGAHVRLVNAQHRGAWEVPVLGAVTPTAAVLLRPDGHVAWAGDLSDPGLGAALDTWVAARLDM